MFSKTLNNSSRSSKAHKNGLIAPISIAEVVNANRWELTLINSPSNVLQYWELIELLFRRTEITIMDTNKMIPNGKRINLM